MTLNVLALNDELGNNASHFFKSGNVLRNPKCLSLKISNLLPPKGLYNTNLEYDLWYDMGGSKEIHGYVYTDALSDFLYIKPANSYFTDKVMMESLKVEPTEEGIALIDKMGKRTLDKYRLRKTTSKHDFVIFLPGTNCIKEALNFDKAKAAVLQGAVVKPHPISSSSLIVHLNNVFGEENVLERKASGHDIMQDAKIVGCCSNSEMGLAAIAAGKGFHMFTDLQSKHFTYTSIYKAILSGGSYRDNLIKLFSSEFSGLVSGQSEKALNKIAVFFNQFSGVTHVESKNTYT